MAYSVTPATTVTDILDRMHLIHQTISVSGLIINPKRYYPADPTNIAGDVVVTPSAPANILFDQNRDVSFTVTRTFQIMIWIKGWLQGVPGESAQRTLEQVIEPLENAYMTRPCLELNDNGMAGVLSALPVRGRLYSGQSVLRPTMTYDLNIQMLKTVRRG